jgi:protein-S-isoprenylcysteine O-methyltransferase Ste14
MLAMNLFANYLALWILWPVTIVSLYVIALLEERELIASLGRVYEEYRERVPMFVPKGRQ